MTRVKDFGVGFETIDSLRQIDYVRRAEEMGFGTAWVPEDYFYRGAFSLASAIACSTKRMRVGIGVLNPYTRHPALTAMEFAALMEISRGRAILGIGASVRHWIETQMGIPWDKPAASMREMVGIVRRIFRGESVTFKGKVFRTQAAKLSFPPPSTEIPIHLGVMGPQNLALAGEIADGVLLSALTGPAYARFAVENLRRGAERAGRNVDDIELGAFLFISVSEHERQAREAVKPVLATLLSMLSATPDIPILSLAGIEPDEIRRFGELYAKGELPTRLVTEKMIDAYAIAGGPEHCRAALAELVDAGVQHPVAFEIPGVAPDETIAGVHRHLMPHFL
ncbi:MAG: LLM class flavin-dependent oxidoreductase [Candidatus Binatus sp.]